MHHMHTPAAAALYSDRTDPRHNMQAPTHRRPTAAPQPTTHRNRSPSHLQRRVRTERVLAEAQCVGDAAEGPHVRWRANL
eukprot:3415118-Prymnesium_polylepis.1